jgi:uncharacterized protein with FMN-binding domain
VKKIALSLFAAAASGALVWDQLDRRDTADALGSAASTGDIRPGYIEVPVPTRAVLFTSQPLSTRDSDRTAIALVAPDTPAPSRRRAAFADVPRSRPDYDTGRTMFVPAAMTVAAKGKYADGTFTGPVVDAYYGLIQIQAIVQGGRLMGIRILKYPSDRRTSVYINRQALPMLQDEVVSAQSENVDIISGATLTSEAFIMSLGAALSEAH